jgi:tRNA A37 threonylcarbamoyladenosine dehydratase
MGVIIARSGISTARGEGVLADNGLLKNRPTDGNHRHLRPDDPRRFGGIARLYGEDGRARLAAARVCVVGIGGVGSWAAEGLARSGVGQLTLIDLDHVAESNINRQIHAADATLGQAKVEAMRERIAGYNPGCVVTVVDDFVTADNTAALLGRASTT